MGDGVPTSRQRDGVPVQRLSVMVRRQGTSGRRRPNALCGSVSTFCGRVSLDVQLCSLFLLAIGIVGRMPILRSKIFCLSRLSRMTCGVWRRGLVRIETLVWIDDL